MWQRPKSSLHVVLLCEHFILMFSLSQKEQQFRLVPHCTSLSVTGNSCCSGKELFHTNASVMEILSLRSSNCRSNHHLTAHMNVQRVISYWKTVFTPRTKSIIRKKIKVPGSALDFLEKIYIFPPKERFDWWLFNHYVEFVYWRHLQTVMVCRFSPYSPIRFSLYSHVMHVVLFPCVIYWHDHSFIFTLFLFIIHLFLFIKFIQTNHLFFTCDFYTINFSR